MIPYRVIAETEEYTICEFKPWYFYILYSILVMILVGLLTDLGVVLSAGIVSILIYFLVVTLPYLRFHQRSRKAMREGYVQISGSKWSFRRPLRVKIMKYSGQTNGDRVEKSDGEERT